MQQQLIQMQPMMAAYYPNNVTTDHIQQYLDENKSLILKIVESQNTGKLGDCAENQSRLQKNLMYLAAIADSQPQPPAMPGQYPPSGIMQQGAHYMQVQQQAQQMTQQQLMAARSSLIYSQQPFSLLQQQQALLSQLGTSSTSSATTGLHMFQGEATNVGGNAAVGSGGFPDFLRSSTGEVLHGVGRGLIGSGKQLEIGSSSAECHSGERGETLYLKPASDDGN